MSLSNLFDQLRDRVEVTAHEQGVPVEEFIDRLLNHSLAPVADAKLFVDHSPSACLAVSAAPDFSVVACNELLTQLMGVSKNELTGCSIASLIPEAAAAQLIEQFGLLSATGGQRHVSLPLARPGQQHGWFRLEIALMEVCNCFLINVFDVTAEVQAKVALAREQQQYQKFIQTSHEGIWMIDLQGQTMFVNQQMAHILGYSVDEMAQLSLWDVMHDEDRADAQAKLAARGEGESEQHDFRFVHKNGTDIWVLINTNPLFDADGNPYGAVGFIADITRRVEAEQHLAKNEQRYRELTELMTDYAFSVEVLADGRLINEWVVGAFRRITGAQMPSIGATVSLAMIVPEDRPLVEEDLKRIIQHNERVTGEYRIKREDGQIVWLRVMRQPVWDEQQQRVIRFYGAAQDVTEQVLARQELVESEERFRMLANQAPIFIWMDDEEGQSIYFNQTWLNFTGQSLLESLGEGWKVQLHPEDRDGVHTAYTTAITQTAPYTVEFRLQRHDGEYRWVRSHGLPRFMIDGTFAGYIGATTDITDVYNTQQALERLVAEQTDYLQIEIAQRRETERELKHERDLLEKVIRMSPAAILRIGTDGQFKFASERAGQVFETTIRNILTSTMQEAVGYLYELDGQPLASPDVLFEEVLTTGEPTYGREVMLLDDKGKQYIYSLNIAPLYDNSGAVSEFIIAVEDITLQKQVEANMTAALEQERKVNAMHRQFTTLVTHEFKNPLTVIQMSCDILRRRYGRMTEDQFFQRIGRVEQQGIRLTGLVNDILHLHQVEGGQYHLQRTVINLHDLIHHIAEEVQIAYEDAVQVQLTLEGAEHVFLDETLMRKLLTNLLGNAVKYSPAGEVVHISYRHSDDELTLVVQDNGIGIPERDLQYLFANFFRASNVENRPGTGLGLVIVKQAVELHGGTIHVTSVENQGSTFVVTLPMV